jgi:hypothetical protein
MTKRILIIIFISVIYIPLSVSYSSASETGSEQPGLWGELSDGFNFSMRFLTFGTYQDISDSTQNPNNDFLKIPRYLADLDLRPDASLNFRRLDLSLKPRMNLQWTAWEDGTQKGEEDWEDDWFINEWLCRLRVTDTLFASYGRENLQWGPSYLFSPSNPFFSDNGRTNPKKEVPGMDFARLVWLPNMEWTISLIMNTNKGRQEFDAWDFQKTYALKLDRMGPSGHAGLILAHQEEESDKIGVFGGWTASDALLLYGDAGFSQGSRVLYPVEDHTIPFGDSMQAKDQESSTWKGSAVLGGAYTFLAGPTLTVEYLYNGVGYDDEQASRYFQLKHKASDAYTSPLWRLSRMTLSQTIDPGLRFLRQNYAMLQYRQNDILDKINLSFSWIQNLDDDSGRLIGNMDCYIGDHIQVFTIGSVNAGDKDTEFRTILDSFIMIGLKYTF